MIRRFRVLTACMGLASTALLLTGCGPRQAGRGPAAADDTRYEVEATKDVTYRDGDDADKDKHKLDLYLPNGKKDFPVVMFVHGGAWVFGDRNFFGVYEGIGKMFARHGIGAVVISYRLSPHVKHPEHVKDVAAAFAWTHKHIGEYGGRADELFLCGHSAGGHLVSLLATDESYLQAEGLSLKDVKGVMPISGVYGIPDKMFNEVFGKDPEVRKQAGPRNHVHEGCPPFFIVYGDQDYPFCNVASEDFCKATPGEEGFRRDAEDQGPQPPRHHRQDDQGRRPLRRGAVQVRPRACLRSETGEASRRVHPIGIYTKWRSCSVVSPGGAAVHSQG